MPVEIVTTWISRKCLACRKMTVHDHQRGESKWARWVEYSCHECGRRFNATSRKSKAERELELVA